VQEHLAVFAYANAEARVVAVVVCRAERRGLIAVTEDDPESSQRVLET